MLVTLLALVFAATAHGALRRGMTWTVLEQDGSYVHVGSDGVTNPYDGDTTIDQYLPILCVQVDGQPAPPIAFDFYNGWVGGSLAVTGPVQGAQLTSQARGDELCSQELGAGYRMAEFHDGGGGWSYWGAGTIASGLRFWTAINDQPANPWNSSGDPLDPAGTGTLRRGMTWTFLGQQDRYVHVGADGVTNAYNGDTTIDQYLPILCVQVDGQPAPGTIAFDFYNGWVSGNLAITGAVQGSQLTSRERADEICAQVLGAGYRMAEFHDGGGGWSYWGAGEIAPGTRFWTAIDDQPANPWNSSGDPLEPADSSAYDSNKPLSTSCGGVSSERVAPPPVEVELEDPFDVENPILGFVPPPPDEESYVKTSGETCQVDGPGTAESPYEKTDAAGKVMAPCAWPASVTVTAGVRDHYALPRDAANLTQAIMQATNIWDPARWIGFDQDRANFHFGHEFQPGFWVPAFYQSGSLTLHLRSIQDIPDNDTISLWAGNSPGWSARLIDLGYRFTPGQETTITLDLRALPTNGGQSNLLRDIGQAGNLRVYIQDDTAVDAMTLKLACDDSAAPPPLVGVVLGSGSSCAPYPEHRVHLDNEDRRNANDRRDWIGATISDKNTTFRLCGLDGRLLTPVAQAGARFAVVALAPSCPTGFTKFERYHDNEDNRPASWDNAPSNSPTYTVGNAKNTNMAFCVATGLSQSVPNSSFPTLGIPYGVFAGKNVSLSRWALARGWLFMDDEDNNNKNSPGTPPSHTFEFLEAGKNTRYYLSRVK